MQQRKVYDESEEINLEYLRGSLLKKYTNKQDEINAQEKVDLKNAIQEIQYPYSLKNILHYVNEAVANLLAASAHPLLKEWGNHCNKFYINDPFNKYVQPETGIVVAKRGGIFVELRMIVGYGQLLISFNGQGIWNIPTNSWVQSPGSFQNSRHDAYNVFHLALYSGCHGSVYYPPINPPNFTEFPMKLISPIHIAAAIGDIALMDYLIAKGCNLEDNYNSFQISAMECAIIFERISSIEFLLKNKFSEEKTFKLVIEKGSFAIIEKLVNMNLPITDEVLSLALKRDHLLHDYLDIMRRKDVQDKIDQQGEVNALKALLNYSSIPIQSLVDLILVNPGIIDHIENEANGNTILNQLVITKETTKVSALMEAIFQASLKTNEINFDIEQKNKQNKTILDLALEQKNNELISAILMHGPKINEKQQSQLISLKIDIPNIHQEKEKRMRALAIQQNLRMETQHQVLRETVLHLANTNEEMVRMRGEFESQALELELLRQTMKAVILELNMIKLPQYHARQNLPGNQINNHNLLFALPEQQPDANEIEPKIKSRGK
jgi:ankyrin repeat protein